nr:pentatricopeptide repeat-containing protein At5g15010, mitochondrial [Ziziphus jujuba var. spinosa]
MRKLIRAISSVLLPNTHLDRPISIPNSPFRVMPIATTATFDLRPDLRPSASHTPSIPQNSCSQFLLHSFSSSLHPSHVSSHAPSIHSDEDAIVGGDDHHNSDDDHHNSDGDECEVLCEETNFKQSDSITEEGLAQDVKAFVDILCDDSACSEMKSKLEQCGITASSELVEQVLSKVRNDWEAAYTFFLWAGKQPDYAHSVREYHSMISILGKMRKFDTAWALIDEMRMHTAGQSLVTSQTLLIMIRRYCAVHDVGMAINTFYAYKRFKLEAGIEEFQHLLSALCRYKNVQDAEHMLFCNRNVFPFNTKSFNIILNGWCNVIVSPREANRIWREMSKRGIQHDVVSYASIISCYSKAYNLNMVLKLINRMKKAKISPDRKVYNAVIYALARGRLVKEAINLIKKMEEKGIAPNVVTYNSVITPLCKARKVDEARDVFDEMLQRGLCPTVQTYHAFFRNFRTGEEVFMFLEKMKNMGCLPSVDTYKMLIRKFCRWRQLDNVSKLWREMSGCGVNPDRSSYIVLIHGLFLNGKLDEAYKYYIEMKAKHFLPEPRTEEMLLAWVSGREIMESQMENINDNQLDCSNPEKKAKSISKRIYHRGDFLHEPETKRVVRKQGFSFWE